LALRVSVVIVNWNGAQFLRACLNALRNQSYTEHEVILVDNGSKDCSVELVRAEYPHVRLIVNSRNEGFAAANNRAIEASTGELVATLNNDTVADSRWLEHLVAAMASDRSLGACASKMLFAANPAMINSTGICLDRAGIAWDRLGGARDEGEANVRCEVFGACAGAALYRREMFEDVGTFDEDFFAYLEDVDLAWRAQSRGWRCLYVPEARVLHVHSGTSIEGSRWKNYVLGRNKVWSVVKNYPLPHLLRYLPAVVLFDLLSIQYSLLARGDISALRGRLAAIGRLRRMLGKRKVIQLRYSVSSNQVVANMEPLVRPDRMAGRYRHLRDVVATDAVRQ
jgi:GT2 family glycosyltransferase